MNANKITIKQKGGKFYLTSVTCALGFVILTVQEVWAGAVSPGGESASNPLSNKKTNFKRTKKQSTYNKNRWHIWEVWHLQSDEVRWEKNKWSESNSEKVSNVQSQAQGWWTLRSSLRGIVSGVLYDFYWIYMTRLVSCMLWFIYFVSMLQCSKGKLFGYGQLNQNMMCQICCTEHSVSFYQWLGSIVQVGWFR